MAPSLAQIKGDRITVIETTEVRNEIHHIFLDTATSGDQRAVSKKEEK